MASPQPDGSDDGSSHMAVDDDPSEDELDHEEGMEGAESEETASPPSSQVQEDEDSNGSSMVTARATASRQAEISEQLDHLQDVSCVVHWGVRW